jgi:hypothetical protein
MTNQFASTQPVGFKNRIEHVAIVGVGGNVGKFIANALRATKKHTITALTRPESKSTVPPGVRRVDIDYTSCPEAELVTALKGQDYLIISLHVSQNRNDTQGRLVRAAGKAGCKYVMPNHWGADIRNVKLCTEYTAGGWDDGRWKRYEDAGTTWTALCCGFWLEHSLVGGPALFGFDLKKKEMTFYDDGKTKINIGTWEICGNAVAALLSLPILPEDENDESVTLSRWFNRPLYVADFLISQRDIFESVLRIWGGKEADWTIKYEPSKERHEKGMQILKAGGPTAQMGFGMQMYARYFYPNGDGDFQSKYGLANDVLGIKAGKLDDHVANAKKLVESGWNYFA